MQNGFIALICNQFFEVFMVIFSCSGFFSQSVCIQWMCSVELRWLEDQERVVCGITSNMKGKRISVCVSSKDYKG